MRLTGIRYFTGRWLALKKTKITKNKELIVFDDAKSLMDFAVQEWEKVGKNAVKEKGEFYVCLSGGKTPVPLYQRIAEHKTDFPWNKTHIFLTDERFVPLNDLDSNFGMIKENLLDIVNIPRENIHAVKIEKNVNNSAKRYEEDIREFFELKENELPAFDLTLLGMGKDGHIASLFPGSEALKDELHLVSSDSLTYVKKESITLTLPVINNSKKIVFLITGKDKKETVTRALAEKDIKLPASLVESHSGEVIYLLDKEAASLLKNT